MTTRGMLAALVPLVGGCAFGGGPVVAYQRGHFTVGAEVGAHSRGVGVDVGGLIDGTFYGEADASTFAYQPNASGGKTISGLRGGVGIVRSRTTGWGAVLDVGAGVGRVSEVSCDQQWVTSLSIGGRLVLGSGTSWFVGLLPRVDHNDVCGPL